MTLATNEQLSMAGLGNHFGPSPILDMVRDQILSEAEHIGVTTAAQLLKMKLSDWFALEIDQIGLCKGSSEIIDLLCQELLANQRIVVPVPTYFGIRESLQRVGSGILPVQVGTEARFELDVLAAQRILEVSQATRSPIWLCNPNNPTGSYFTPEVIKLILEHAPSWVVIDEAYLEYIDPGNATSAIAHLDQHPNLIVTKTFSKAFALPETRMGIIVARPEVVVTIEHKAAANSAQNYLQARYALDDLEHLHHFSEWVTQELAMFYAALGALDHIEASPLSVTGVMLLRHKLEFLHDLLERQQVKTLNLNHELGIEGEGYVRIGLQASALNQAFLAVLGNL